ncbi:hypothetical protein GCM10023321_01960 [Pseudonocardia eucalypti]|uniref:Uncharacterized protein n=1 Tax=Pseudonocardia eucalypti TaxID=648755 RepID=A0ABP9PEK7_9PSEU|nr:hypothetical protein [Pseudonocardia eucalypti]
MDGIDPCTLVTSGLLAELGVGTEQRRRKPNTVQTSASSCEWSDTSARPILTLEVWVVPDRPVTDYIAEEGAEVTTVAGFPALDSESGGFDPDEACMVRVDVAAGQGIWAGLTSEYGKLPGASHELMCRKAHVAAEGVMRALLARTG